MNLLKDFFLWDTWQVWVLLIITITSFAILYWAIKKYKLAFHWRVLIGLTIGIVIGICVQAAMKFPGKQNIHDNRGVVQYTEWINIVSRLFIQGISIMIIPLVFLAVLRIFSKKGRDSLGWVTTKGIIILISNVAIAYGITFWIGYALKLGDGFSISADKTLSASSTYKSLPDLIIGYIPDSFFETLIASGVVLAMVLALIVGIAIRRLSSAPKTMKYFENAPTIYEMFWKIINSVLIFFIKIMPYAIITMMARAIITRPIGEMKTIGMILAVGYIGIIIMFGYHTLTMYLSGVKAHKIWAKSWKPVLTGFSTQSSMATLPVALETMKDELKFKGQTQELIQPLSTTIGLTGCAGVQSGVILSLFWGVTKSTIAGVPFTINMSLASFFFTGMIVTMIVSFGIAGVPGTATIVTRGVLSSMGFVAFANPVMALIASLNGIFDMGRTAVNVHGGIQASTICAKGKGELPDELVWRKKSLFDISKLLKILKLDKISKKIKIGNVQKEKVQS